MRLTKEQIAAIEETLQKGDRVELVPAKEGCRIFRVKRSDLEKTKKDASP